MISLTLAMAVTLVSDDSYKLGSFGMEALPYVDAYVSCFKPDTDMGHKIVTQLNVPVEQLPQFCRDHRATWFDGAVAAMKKANSHNMLERTRQLETVFSNIERHNPIPQAAPSAPTQ